MPVMPIPNDWDESTWDCHVIDWPSSPQWRGILYGFITQATRGRFWDGRTGSIKDVQAIGLEIEGRNPIMSCQDLIDQLEIINTNLVSITNNLNLSVQQSQTLNSNISVQNDILAVAQATASSASVSSAMVSLENYVIVDARPLGGNEAPTPTPEEAAKYGITDQLVTDDKACDAAYWITLGCLETVKWLRNVYIPGWFATSQATLSALTWALRASALRFPSAAPWLLGGATLTALVEGLVFLEKELIADPALLSLETWLDTDFDNIVCEMIVARSSSDTSIIQDQLVSMALTASVEPKAVSLVRGWFNLNNLALLFFDAAEIIVPDRPPSYDCDCGGGV